MKAVVAAFNQEKALVGAFSVITNLRMELFEALISTPNHQTFRSFIVPQWLLNLSPYTIYTAIHNTPTVVMPRLWCPVVAVLVAAASAQYDYVSECPAENGFFADALQCDRYYECQDGEVGTQYNDLSSEGVNHPRILPYHPLPVPGV